MNRPIALRWFSVWTAVLSSAGIVLAADGPVRLVPAPQQVKWAEEPPVKLLPDQVDIVIGVRATESERYAAETLQAAVAKRFGLRWNVVAEFKDRPRRAVELLLGQRNTHDKLNDLCSRMNIDLSEKSPGFDGYVIEFVKMDGQDLVVVGGSNARGVIYGQDTLFQMIAGSGGETVLCRASIRDWPSIPWRGRPQTTMANYFRPGELDCYASSRINFIDLREGTYAIEPGEKLDSEMVRRTVAEARKRGFVVFAIVNCGVKRDRYDKVMDTFRESIALGADGLWVSFDDKGPGEDPVKLVTDVLALGREHGISGARIAVTPPKGSYQTVADDSNGDFNRKIMKIPGMEEALWFWTPTPTMERLEEGRSIGLKTGVSWWHNWPRPDPGFTHTRTGGSIMAAGRRPYSEIMAVREGWNRPTYDVLADAGRCTEAVMPWGGNTWGVHYLIPAFGWWAWNPTGHVWNDVRARIYSTVVGPDQVEAAMAFDDTLIEVKKLFRFAIEGGRWLPLFPGRLQRLEDREKALGLLAKMEQLRHAVGAKAPEQTMLPADLLKSVYLDAMANELTTGQAAAAAPYPDYWYPEHQRKILGAIHAGRLDEADKLADSVRDRLLKDLDQIRSSLGHLTITGKYVEYWTQWAKMTAADWQKLVAERKAMVKPHLDQFGYYVYITEKMLTGLSHVPLRWGSGGARQQSVVRATVLPKEQELYYGKWQGGIHHRKAGDVACFWMARDGAGTLGEYSELPVEVPISGRRDALHLLFHVSNWNRESLGLETVLNRWGGHRVIRLLRDDTVLWEADIGVHRTDGEWFLVKLPTLPEDLSTLKLRLRVEDVRDFALDCTVFVGPIRLVEMTQ
ncbi:MAG TPA: glycoside hydrolase family 20 zincin-like fold domain-containing protein [Phycisphaerae bacterium]|nr:glycoside hydrolase family 20 zincin-like fold domain-containing protein [Phycisphaerae bacterium]